MSFRYFQVYYRTYRSETRSPFFFRYNYQIVMMGVAKHKLRAEDPDAENTYLEIYSMDDVKSRRTACELDLDDPFNVIALAPKYAP